MREFLCVMQIFWCMGKGFYNLFIYFLKLALSGFGLNLGVYIMKFGDVQYE